MRFERVFASTVVWSCLSGCSAPSAQDAASGGGQAATAGAAGGSAGGAAGSAAGGQGGVAGSAGAGGMSGGAGMASSAGSGGGPDNSAATPSAGCGTLATDAPGTFVAHQVVAAGYTREYFVRLPVAYDPARAYPTVILGAGCGGTGETVIPVHTAAQADAIVVGLSPSFEVAGRDCFMTESPTSPEIDFFDAVLAAMKQGYCVDESRVFMGGFSSGSWLTNLIGCARGDVVRAQGNAAGGPPPLPECTGPIAAIMVHDVGDEANSIDLGRQTRDRLRQLNGCTEATAPWDAQFPECVAYQGCMAGYPLVWCETSGKGHSDNVPISTQGFWKFWSSLPPLAP